MKLRIRELRKARKLTVEQLADMVGLSKSYVSEIENGKKQANQNRIEKFANALNVPVYDLLDEETLSLEMRELLNNYSNMSDSERETLLTVARSITK